jgi:pimeloyl-ACP methyl ester carboxylesterase
VLLFVFAGVAAYIHHSTPPLPPDVENIITDVVSSSVPEFIKGKTGYAKSGDIKIWYESIEGIGPPKGTVLLMMGISNDAMGWPPDFLHALGSAGYQIVRYDYRGTGMSDWVENWDPKRPYSVSDMAADGLHVLDALGIRKAHVVGVSMGGMVAQQFTIDHPERVESLTSIMSSGNILDRELPPISSDVVWKLILAGLKYGVIGGERNTIRLHIVSRLILRGSADYELDARSIAEQVLYNLRKRKGYNSAASSQHHAAVSASGSRYDQLRKINVPALIIHGTADPFIPIAHGEKCAELIPGADVLWLEGMGHDIPGDFVGPLVRKMVGNFQKNKTGNGIIPKNGN